MSESDTTPSEDREITIAPEKELSAPRTDMTVAEMREWLRNWVANATGQPATAPRGRCSCAVTAHRWSAGQRTGSCSASRRRPASRKRITPHSLRRSFATLALQAGVPMEIVQFDMDHASSRTTAGYNRLGVAPEARASNTVAALQIGRAHV